MAEVSAKHPVDGVFELVGETLNNGEGVRILRFGNLVTRTRPPVPAGTLGTAWS